MKWTIEFETKICKTVIKTYVIDKSRQSISNFLLCLNTYNNLEVPESSIKMKISNIKAILEELNIDNTIPGGILYHYSKQNKRIVENILDEKCL